MFIRFSLPKIFRLRGRSRKTVTEKQQRASSDVTPQVPAPVPVPSRSTVTLTPLSPSSDPFASDLTISHWQPSPSHHVRRSSSLSHHSDSGSSGSEMDIPIPIIVIDEDVAPVQVIPAPRTTPAFLTTIPPSPTKKLSQLTGTKANVNVKPRTDRSKSIMFAVSKPSADDIIVMKPRRATMGARPITVTRRGSKRETKIVFSRRNSRRESQQMDLLRNSKRASEITLVGEPSVDLQGKLEVEVEVENKRKSKRETKRVSKMSSPKQKRQSRWEKEVNDPNTQEVLRALSGFN